MEHYFFLLVFPWLSAAVLPLYLCLLHSIWRSDSSHLEIHGAAADSTACCWYQRKLSPLIFKNLLVFLSSTPLPLPPTSAADTLWRRRGLLRQRWGRRRGGGAERLPFHPCGDYNSPQPSGCGDRCWLAGWGQTGCDGFLGPSRQSVRCGDVRAGPLTHW